jgi:hypothetical protein
MLFEERGQPLGNGGVDGRLNFARDELVLGLRAEGWLRHFHGKHAGEAFTHVLAGNVELVALFENVIAGDVFANDIAHGHAQTGDVCAAVALGNVVRVGG